MSFLIDVEDDFGYDVEDAFEFFLLFDLNDFEDDFRILFFTLNEFDDDFRLFLFDFFPLRGAIALVDLDVIGDAKRMASFQL